MTWALQVTSELGRGTGVAISPTLVLTAEHVVRGATAVQVRATSGKTITFSALPSDQDAALDVALLSCLRPPAGSTRNRWSCPGCCGGATGRATSRKRLLGTGSEATQDVGEGSRGYFGGAKGPVGKTGGG